MEGPKNKSLLIIFKIMSFILWAVSYSEGKWHETDVVFWLKKWNKMTKQREMKRKKKIAILFIFLFQIENLKAKKDQIFLYF